MSQPTTEELKAVLEGMLAGHLGGRCRISRLERRPCPKHSSFALEELDVDLDGGTFLPIVFKNLSRQALSANARQAKPPFLYHPLREINAYRMILAAQSLGTPIYYGAVVDPSAGRCWLFLEKVCGRELYEAGEISTWQEAARWLAGFHGCSAGPIEVRKLAEDAGLCYYDRHYYRLWMDRALAFAEEPVQHDAGSRNGIAWLARRYDRVVERLAALTPTIIHGEFYASNILIAETGSRVRVCPVDWEMSAAGPGLVDLAALTAGNWQEEQRAAIAHAYYQALPATGNLPDKDEFLATLDFCHLHLAVLWLGWSPDWTPPPDHAHNWLGEALRLAEKLGL